MTSIDFFKDEIEKKVCEISDLAHEITKSTKAICYAQNDIDLHGLTESNLISLRTGIDRIETAYAKIGERHDQLGYLESKLSELRRDRDADVETTGYKVSDVVECQN